MCKRALLLFLISAAGIHSARAQVMRDTIKGIIKTGSATTIAPDRKAFLIFPPNGIRKHFLLDSATMTGYQTDVLSKLLTQQLPVFVRTYGVNGPANLSLRGASAAQTAVRWNGVPMQNGATGLVDLSTIPIGVLGYANLSYGSLGGNGGSGAVGGILDLSDDPLSFQPKSQTVTMRLAVGSFQDYRSAFKMSAGDKKVAFSIGASFQNAENNFEYTNSSGKQIRLANSNGSVLNLYGKAGWLPGKKNRFTTSVWYNKSNRNIPPALFESSSVKKQEDQAFRSSINYQHNLKKGTFITIGSLMDEWFRYQDSSVKIVSAVHTRQWYVSPELILDLGVGYTKLSVSLPQQYNLVVGFDDKRIIRSGIVAQLERFKRRVLLSGNGRMESINGKIYGAGGLNGAYWITNAFKLNASAGYAYRSPTLNELYYVPGGNVQLLPEQGYNAELGYVLNLGKPSNHTLTFSHHATAFFRDINNWIIWFGGAIWTPHNIAEVVSKGIETENKFIWRRKKINWEVSLNGAWISSKTKESLVAGDGSINKQIPYAPNLLGQGNIGFKTNHWRLNFNQVYTGLRYYNTDETGALEAFALSNLQAGYLWKTQRWILDVNAQVNNLWNHRCIEVAGRPAPGINWLIGLSVSALSPKEKSKTEKKGR